MWKNWNLSSKIAVTVSVLIFITVIALTTVSSFNQQLTLREDLENQATLLVETLSVASDNNLFSLDVASLTTIAEQVDASNDVTLVKFYDQTGRLIVSTIGSDDALFSFEPNERGVDIINERNLALEWGDNALNAAQPVLIGQQVVGAVELSLSTATIREQFVQAQLTATIAALLATIISIAVAILLSRSITTPLRKLSVVAEQFSSGNRDLKADITSNDEVGSLAKTFNTMIAEVNDRQVALENLNQSLEKRVAERTAELEQARDEALAAQRIANENSRLKSEFLSTMSHELRTPMNAIEGFVGIILSRMGGADFNEKTESYLHKVRSNSRRLLGLINDFLDLSRIESGRLELVNQPMSPESMATQWRSTLISLADNKGLDFTVDVDPNLPTTIHGDEEALSKVAINLLGNAIKFTSEGSVSLQLKQDGDQMDMIVSDTGMGIPPHAREFIFDEFRQVDQSSRREHGGTGLGLAIVSKLVRAMNGTVSLESEVGEGTTFHVRVPMNLEAVVL
ncbi:MAG: ATP-binding protein [Chloroflexota bacterium]